MSAVIRVENLSKQYRLGQVGTGTLSDDLTRIWYRLRGKEDPFLKIGQVNDRSKKAQKAETTERSGLFSRLSPLASRLYTSPDLVWALKDIHFEVQEGEVLGIIGRNGAGKSTLLKILARVTNPSTGEVKIRGRIASLLEVGTGFHPDLTGRENIYLNGAILGMRKYEITRKLDEIIEFSGCERYIDTPVKRYSSGMYVRLAFAVAAHLEPEILIVDEVLAVGDAEFQKKCLGKMKDVAKGGRTVLFVSHNLDAIENLCSRAILLRQATLAEDGPVEDVLNEYIHHLPVQNRAIYDMTEHAFRWNTAEPIFKSVTLLDGCREELKEIRTGDPLSLVFSIKTNKRLKLPQLGVGFNDFLGRRVFSVATYLSSSNLSSVDGECRIHCRIDALPLVPGTYSLSISIGDGGNLLMDAIDDALSITIRPSDYLGTDGHLPHSLGAFAVRSHWSLFE
jgi:lipopolysaccharide transport system ATP-binding protein